MLRALAALLLLLIVGAPARAQVPDRAWLFRRPLVREARVVWGLTAPIAVFASQVHQESSWRPDARSPYAAGLAQFTPATAADMARRYPELVGAAPLNPDWALRALVRYDRELQQRALPAADACDRFGFALSAYNGGEGNVRKQRRAAVAAGDDQARWFGHVENYRVRATWAHTENRAYPRRILLTLQPLYRAWGSGVDCEATS